MSLLDTIKDPVKAAKDGWNSFTGAVSHTADLASEVLNGAVDTAAKTISSVTSIDANTIKSAINTVGTVITNPMKAVTTGLSLTGLPSDTQAAVKNITSLALMTSPVGVASLTLTQVAPDKWLSDDKKVSVQRVASLEGNADAAKLDNFWALYDKQNAGNKDLAERAASSMAGNPKDTKAQGQTLDFSVDNIYQSNIKPRVERTAEQATEKTNATGREYTNAAGEKVNVSVENGEMNYRALKDGKVITQANQTAEQSTITHSGATATLDTKLGRLSFSTEQVKILQEAGNAIIDLVGGGKIVKEHGRIKLFDQKGRFLQKIAAGALQIGTDIQMFQEGTDLRAKAREVGATHKTAGEEKPAVNMFMTTDGDMLWSLPDGSLVQRRKEDGNVILQLACGQVVLVEAASGKVLILRDNKFEAINENSEEAKVAQQAMAETGVKVRNGQINLNDYVLDLNNQYVQWRNASNELQTVDLSQAAPQNETKAVTVTTETQTVVAQGDKVTTTDTFGAQYTTDIKKGDIKNEAVHVLQEEIRVKQKDGQEAIIKTNNDVAFDGGKGPKLNHDGGMQLDEQTSTDSKGNVRSGSFTANIFSTDNNTVKQASLEVAVNNTAATARTNANSVYGKAASGMVTYSDISALNADLSSVSGLINQLAAAGAGHLIPQLQNSCAAIIEAINFATPKAAACQIAMDRGVTAPSVIKQIEDGTYGKSPEQAVAAVLQAA